MPAVRIPWASWYGEAAWAGISALGPGTALAGRPSAAPGTMIFSPGVNRHDVAAKFGDGALHCPTWADVVTEVSRRHGATPRVAVFPAGALQDTGR